MTQAAYDNDARQAALTVVRRLRDAGYVAYFAGGCVRDELLGLKPKDYDVATDAPPQRVRQLFSNTQAVGQAFGVILVRLGGCTVEVATFRTDGAYEDGRRPTSVQFTTAEQDAQRRDFTLNGLFLDPLSNEVIDYVGGRDDLNARILRAIGRPSERFAEDHLRLLRAVRFASRFELAIDPATAEAITRHAPSLKGISPERIAEELRKALTPTTRAAAWRLLWRHKLGNVIFRFGPFAAPTNFEPQGSIFLSLQPDEHLPFSVSLAAAAACILRSGDQPPREWLTAEAAHAVVKGLRRSLKLSNEEMDELDHTLAGAAQLAGATPPATLAQRKRFLARPMSGWSRELMDAVAAVCGDELQRWATLRPELDELSKTDYAPPPLLNGDDLLAVGLSPGPKFRKWLDATYDAQLEGALKTKNEALEHALALSRG